MAELNMAEALNQALIQEMKTDKDIVVLGEDVGLDGGVFRITEGLLERYGSSRVMDTPLSEDGIVGTSIGMAVYGLKPVAEIQFMGFSYLGLNQLISHAARIRNRTRGRYTCPMVLRMPFGGGVRALEHHCESTEALYAHIPGLKVVIPSGPYDAKGLLASSIRDPDTVIFLEHKKVYRLFKEDVPEKSYTIPLGKANIVQEGKDITIISYGAMLHVVKNSVKELDNISAEVIDLRTISPLDVNTIIASVKKTGRCIVVHEAPKSFGVAAEIIALINEKALLHLEAPVGRVTGFDVPYPYFSVEKRYLPNEKRVKEIIERVVHY